MNEETFAGRLLDWYAEHGRTLPWRGVTDPYAVLVSEYMAQQTRVDTVIPYYLRWMEQFPTIQVLAAAPQEAVLKAWEGLGYYARARNLHKAAQVIVTDFAGHIPAFIGRPAQAARRGRLHRRGRGFAGLWRGRARAGWQPAPRAGARDGPAARPAFTAGTGTIDAYCPRPVTPRPRR